MFWLSQNPFKIPQSCQIMFGYFVNFTKLLDVVIDWCTYSSQLYLNKIGMVQFQFNPF